MYKGIPEKFQNKVIKEVNRKDAIKIGVNLMKTNDILLIAGKGHEKFQDVNGKQIHFDEKLILKKLFKMFVNKRNERKIIDLFKNSHILIFLFNLI